MTDEIHQILLASDAVEGDFEFPAHITCEDRVEARRSVANVKKEIEQLIGEDLRSDNGVQDATFWEQLGVYERKVQRGGATALLAQMAIVFSNFGNLVTVWSVDPESLNRYPLEDIVNILEGHGFVYIPRSSLDAGYDGRHATRVKITWLDRFFSYI